MFFFEQKYLCKIMIENGLKTKKSRYDFTITSTLTFLLLLCQYTNAQLLEVNQPLFSDEPFFNSHFIKVNKIKSITGSRSSKKIQDIIRSKGLDFYYEFDENGYLSKQIATFLVGGVNKDTNIIC